MEENWNLWTVHNTDRGFGPEVSDILISVGQKLSVLNTRISLVKQLNNVFQNFRNSKMAFCQSIKSHSIKYTTYGPWINVEIDHFKHNKLVIPKGGNWDESTALMTFSSSGNTEKDTKLFSEGKKEKTAILSWLVMLD